MQLQQTEFIVEKPKTDVEKSTLPEFLVPLMDAPSMIAGRCFICGRKFHLEQHHIVFRSAGKLFKGGREVPKPTITLCGFGNNLRDANGRYLCHGLAHHRMLHFRWVPSSPKRVNGLSVDLYGSGRLQFLKTDEPTDYLDALDMDGWMDVKLLREDS